MDGIEPECTNGECPIPNPGPQGERLLHVRGLLVRLKGVVDSDTICRLTGVDLDDLELLAALEDEIHKEEEAKHGKGHQTHHSR